METRTMADPSLDWEMSAFTCITCRVAFADADLQRGHYKTDWHRYNLKRKVAELPPVTAENFQQRVLAQKAQVAEAEKDTASRCHLCNKHFSSANAYDNHLHSKKHKEAAAKQERQLEAEVAKRNEKNQEKGLVADSESEKVALKNAKNLALKESLKKEEAKVGQRSSGSRSAEAGTSGQSASSSKVTVEDVTMEDDDSDAESEESWDGEAIGLEECLFCSHISQALEANVEHMTKTHSFFIPDIEYLMDLEGLVTYLGQKVGEGNVCLWCNEKGKTFYSTQAVQKHMRDKGHCKMLHEGDALFEYSDYYDYRSSYPDYQEGAEGGAQPMQEDVDVDDEALESTEESCQLVLPSGSAIGHRSLARYYRQKLKPTRVMTYRPVNRIIAQYKALGWTGTTGVEAARRAKDIAYVQRMKSRHFTRMGIKNNKFQTHFRPQVVF